MPDALALGRVLLTTGQILGHYTRQADARGVRAKLWGALSSGAHVTVRDVEAIVGGQAMPDATVLDDFAAVLGVDTVQLACRAELVKGMDDDQPEEPGVRFVLSDATEDRDGDVIEQDWRLDEFRRNPVAPWAHDYRTPPVGRWAGVGVRGAPPRLTARLIADAGEHNPLGRLVDAQIRDGFLSACSVGFMPGAMAPRAGFPEEDPRHGRRGYVMTANRLLEASVVVVPANGRALAERGGWMVEALRDASAAEPADVRALILEALDDPDIQAKIKSLTGPVVKMPDAPWFLS